ncbi:ABC transporter ATP-binding protein [Lawsonibacter celer]|uniref:ABC transporter ATP-binding protein n=1 Tax=Lawsonibacter celer TaxID=2986526 RepID=UPI001647140C|nr:oligopeptide/dipeptide ABC transporter ATP-binding protein [Lawsonibacter celer]
MSTPERKCLLELEGISKWFPRKRTVKDAVQHAERQYVKAVSDVSLQIYEGENLGLVGESGCGKSTLARTIMRLYDPTAGQIILDGRDITRLKGNALRQERIKMQMVFQDPYSSLNPRMTVYEMLEEPLKVYHFVPKDEIPQEVDRLLRISGLSPEIANRFPGEFSGGQRQRLGIARALALRPRFIIADEPVSALDVSIQAQILNLLADLQEELNLTVLFISHDLQVVRHISDRVIVMYLGAIVESGKTEDVFDRPHHPYTDVLMKAAPSLDVDARTKEYAIEGDPPSPISIPSGCKFHPRCTRCQERCRTEQPALTTLPDGRQIACHFPLNTDSP